MPISAGLREDIAVYRGFIGQQYILIKQVLEVKKNNLNPTRLLEPKPVSYTHLRAHET